MTSFELRSYGRVGLRGVLPESGRGPRRGAESANGLHSEGSPTEAANKS